MTIKNMKTYNCKVCGEGWKYIEEDYIKDGGEHPQICPLCDMPISQMFKDITKDQGVIQAIKHIFIRVKGKLLNKSV